MCLSLLRLAALNGIVKLEISDKFAPKLLILKHYVVFATTFELLTLYLICQVLALPIQQQIKI